MGRALALASALVFVFAATAVAAPKRFFGVVYDRDVAAAPADVQDQQFAVMRTSGIRTVRTVISWAAAQPVQGQPPDLSGVDAFVARAARNDIEVLPIVMYAPAWARVSAKDDASSPRNPADYVAFLNTLVARYGPAGSFWVEHPDVPKRPLHTWQIWNEPQLRYQWAESNWQHGYGVLLHAAHAALKRDDPHSTVVLAGATNFAWDALQSLYAKGHVKGQFDVAALHPYTSSAARVVQAARLFRAELRRHGDGRKPVWITELAWPASKGKVKPPQGLATLPTTDQGMARRLTHAYKLLMSTRVVQRAYWYTWASAYKKANGIFDFTGLEHYDPARGRFTATPALRAYRKLAHR